MREDHVTMEGMSNAPLGLFGVSIAWIRLTKLLVFARGQGFLLLSFWLLFAGILAHWQTGSVVQYEVYSSYLDQSLMSATSATVFWYLRGEGPWPRLVGTTLAALALINTLRQLLAAALVIAHVGLLRALSMAMGVRSMVETTARGVIA